MMDFIYVMLWVFGAVIVIVTLFIMRILIEIRSNKREMGHYISQMPEISRNQFIISDHGLSALVLDEERRRICFVIKESNVLMHKFYSFGQLLKAEIVQDGTTIISTSRSSQINRALVGGMVAGGLGAVIGGLSGREVKKNVIHRISLRIAIANLSGDDLDIAFLSTKVQVLDGDVVHRQALRRAQRWHNIISSAIKIAASG